MFQDVIKKVRKSNKGFTLVELLLVISILAILTSIAVPKITTSRKKAAITAHDANVRILHSAANMYIADEGLPKSVTTWKEDNGEKIWRKYLHEWPKVPKGIGKDDEEYVVTIDTEGTVEVKPDKLIDEKASKN